MSFCNSASAKIAPRKTLGATNRTFYGYINDDKSVDMAVFPVYRQHPVRLLQNDIRVARLCRFMETPAANAFPSGAFGEIPTRQDASIAIHAPAVKRFIGQQRGIGAALVIPVSQGATTAGFRGGTGTDSVRRVKKLHGRKNRAPGQIKNVSQFKRQLLVEQMGLVVPVQGPDPGGSVFLVYGQNLPTRIGAGQQGFDAVIG
jgi:hypothetical protein